MDPHLLKEEVPKSAAIFNLAHLPIQARGLLKKKLIQQQRKPTLGINTDSPSLLVRHLIKTNVGK